MQIEPILLSAGGALFLHSLSLVELKNIPKNQWPDFKTWVYWIPFIIYPLVGGFVGHAYFCDKIDFDRILALHVGAASPLILRTMATAIPKN